MNFFKKIFLVLCLMGVFHNTYAGEKFIIDNIVLKGLQRVDVGTIYAYLPFEVGDIFDTSATPSVIKTLFKTKFFNDIIISRDNNTIVINFDERPTIIDIEFEGLEDISDEQLDKILDAADIAPGRIYDSSVLEKIKSELREQNFARGIYTVDIKIEETLLSDNRVFLKVKVSAGVRAKIKQIKITGNKNFSDKKLTKNFETALPVWYMFWSDSGVYSSPMLAGDIDRLINFYQNKGFMDFAIESTQVSLSKNKEEVYITINIDEGEQYIVNEIHVAGKLILPIEEISDLLRINTGEYISKAKINQTTENIKARLSEEGYAFSRINTMPEKNAETNEVNISFFIDPGNRAYVRRINISGNVTTQDEVFRREIRQMEGGWYSSLALKNSKERLKRLAFVDNVSFEEVRVPGSTNKLDLNVRIEEKRSGNFTIGAGLGGSGEGLSLNAGISQDNFLGFGSKVAFNINTEKTKRNYSFNFSNPYHNLDSVSRSFGFNLQKTKSDDEDTVSTYDADRIGVNYSYGLPMTEDNRFYLSLNYLKWDIRTNDNSPTEILDFITSNGESFDNFSFKVTYAIDKRDSGAFPRSGFKTSLGAEVFVPGSDLEYYKITFRTDSYFQINKEKDIILRLMGITRFGEGYGGTQGLPFYDKFRAGGPKSIRGYRKNSLSPLDSEGKPLGGDFMLAGSSEIIFRPPVDVAQLRTAFFIDYGGAFKDYDSFEFDDLKGSMGLSVKWISPFGGVSVSITTPLNSENDDKTESFQFNLGTN
ncbi:MAG: outer membrane protein assembly factor BamA [Gammaproteobacteria bacterium]|jgi:outer membrane protein insertion porin family|nr:outer membrane protein assembly factor BamA [Gammaproteobacteria bacterium]MBT6754941.1 outer membrane protein assembly factor BamA [Gammaproteobacteria bacterium]MBT7523990.1 outer membrane protein assembly factor BamA [Gammaproteobacteria bacterium]